METFTNYQENLSESEIPTFNPKLRRIVEIESLTGLNDLDRAFDDPLNNSEVELLVSFLDRKYDFSEGRNDVYTFLIQEIGFPERILNSLGLNFPAFYYGMTVSDACFIILTKLIEHGNKTNYCGFPEEFLFSVSQKNKIQTYEGKRWFPFCEEGYSTNYYQLLATITRQLRISTDNLYFHGTSWDNAFTIMEEIVIRTSNKADDFGKKNFYVTDSFLAACLWAKRNEQAAVVIFNIPPTYIESLENRIQFSLDDLDSWKEMVFTARNFPSRGGRAKQREHREYIDALDSQDIITGPIMANPGAKSIEEVNYLKYRREVPFQFCFKTSTVADLNGFLTITLFFRQL